MSKFIPTNQRNGACEVCGNTSGKCRRYEALHLCMNFADAQVGEMQNGLKCIKSDQGKGWALFKIDDCQQWSEEQHQVWQAKAELRQEQQVRQNQARQQRSIPATERNQLYQQLLGELMLHLEDRADLHRRGFTDLEIEQVGFKSVDRYQSLQQQYPERLPGIGKGGRQLINTHAGYLCPIRDGDGLIVAFQVRLRTLAEGDKNRYRWLSNQQQGHVLHFFPQGGNLEAELPLSICCPAHSTTGVALAEGTGAKPNLVALRLGYFTIGAAGGQWLASPMTFKKALERGVEHSDGNRQITIFPDAGDVKNPAVMRRWQQVIEQLEQWNYVVQIGWWQQLTKDEVDIDELTPEQTAAIQFISPQDFLAIASELRFQNQPLLKTSTHPKTEKAWELWYDSRQFDADYQTNDSYFNAPVPQSGTATYIRSGTGTGKTYWLLHVIRQLADKGFLSIGYRNSLLLQFAEADELAGTWHHLQQDLKGNPDAILTRDPFSKILCCIDSLPYFEPQDFDGKILILDEVESIVEQLLKANTAVSYQREKIKNLLSEALRRCDRVICLDGHLRNATIKYLQQLIGHCKTPVHYLNTYIGNKGRVEFLEGMATAKGIKANDRSPVIEALTNNSNRFVIGADSQEELEALERIFKAQGRTTLRFDSTTGRMLWAQQFLKDPAKYLREHNIEILLYSPSAEAGLNIDIKGYFSDAYFLFFGVITTNAQLQLIARVRDPQMQLHIWCTLQGLPSTAVSKSAIPEQISEEVKQYVLDCATASLAGISTEAAALKLVQQLVEFSADAHFEHEMLLTAIENHERANLRDCLRQGLLQSGYQVESVIGQSVNLTQVSQQRDEIRQDKAIRTYTATDITTEEANRKARSFSATAAEKYQVARRRLLDRLPGIEHATYSVIKQVEDNSTIPAMKTAEFSISDSSPTQRANSTDTNTIQNIEKPVFDAAFIRHVKWEKRGLISQIELRWLIEHPEAAKLLQQIRWHKRLSLFTDPDEPDSGKRMNLSNYHSRWLQIHRLLELGIEFFLQPGATWSADTPAAIAFWQAAKHPRTAKAIGRRVGKSSVCSFIGAVLKSVGYQTESKWNSQKKQWVYRVLPQPEQDPIHTAIYQAVERRFEATLSSERAVLDWQAVTCARNSPQSQAATAVETRSPSPDFVLITQEGDQMNNNLQLVANASTRGGAHAIETAELTANAELLSEATEFGREAVVAILQPWTEQVRVSVFNLLRSASHTVYRHLQDLLKQSPVKV